MDAKRMVWWQKTLFLAAIILATGLAIAGFFIADYLDKISALSSGKGMAAGVFFLSLIPLFFLCNHVFIEPVYGKDRKEIFIVLLIVTGCFMVRTSTDLLAAAGYLGVFCVLGFFLFFLHPRFRPLSEDEASDPLERQVLLHIPYEDAFILGERAIQDLNTLFHFWKISSSDKATGRIIGKECFFGHYSPDWEVSLLLQSQSERATLITIRCTPVPPIIYPLLAHRRQIRGLDTLSAFLKKRG